MALLFEYGPEIKNKRVVFPDGVKSEMGKIVSALKPAIDDNAPGSKIAKSLVADTSYNRKGKNAHQNGNGSASITVNDAEVRMERMEKMPEDSVEYMLNGGKTMERVYKDGIRRARGVKQVEPVRPPKQNTVKPPKVSSSSVKPKTADVDPAKVYESVSINEGIETYEDAYSEYGPWYVLDSFVRSGGKGSKQSWGPLINPDMYAKALREFVQYGKLVRFPSKYVYQWMGIIIKNAVILEANTILSGHAQHGCDESFEFVEERLREKYGDDRETRQNYNDDAAEIELTPYEVIELCKEYGVYLTESTGVHDDGQYDLFMNQEEVDAYDAKKKWFEGYREAIEYANAFNEKHVSELGGYDRKFVVRGNKIWLSVSVSEYFEEIGLYDYMQMPDGSDAISDYGLAPLFEIIEQYDDSKTPEQTLVLVNKALDVSHARGDLASIFITGGSRALSAISERGVFYEKLMRRGVYITESQLARLLSSVGSQR